MNLQIKKEIKILIENNPYISNREIGKKLNVSRSTVQWHIKSLGIKRDRKLNQKYNNTNRSFEISITENAEQIILGSILGDGCISKWRRHENSKNNLNSCLSIVHTEPQLEYLLYKKKFIRKIWNKMSKSQ